MPAATAAVLVEELGPEAPGAVALCIEECRRLGHGEAERFWREVAHELRSTSEDGGAARDHDGQAPASDLYFRKRRWGYMQKAEAHRRRGLIALQRAGGSEHLRSDLLDMALQWLDLARQYEWLAETL
jgi:hypothetical protein